MAASDVLKIDHERDDDADDRGKAGETAYLPPIFKCYMKDKWTAYDWSLNEDKK